MTKIFFSVIAKKYKCFREIYEQLEVEECNINNHL